MATRNERKRRAKERHQLLMNAVLEAMAKETASQQQETLPSTEEYPFYDGLSKFDALRFTHVRGSTERHGKIVKGGKSKLGKFKAEPKPVTEWGAPTRKRYLNKSGASVPGEPRKKYVR